MENEPELIRDQMQETRTALTEKLDSLQQKVADTVESITTPVTETVQTVKDAVEETVSTVKDSVSGTVDSVKTSISDTVDSVKETFDVAHQVERHPWPMVLGSVAAGFMLGRLLSPPGKMVRSIVGPDKVASGMSKASKAHNGARAKARAEEKAASSEPGVLDGLGDAFKGELDNLKALGISVGVGLLRDLMAQSIEGEIGSRFKDWMDGLTEKLGAKPLKEPIVSTQATEREPSMEERSEAMAQAPIERVPTGKAKTSHQGTRRW